jgi:aminoglycoside phosphotransferase (APT) family kinase protein
MISEQGVARRLAAELGFDIDAVEVLIGGQQNHAVRVRGPAVDAVIRFARDVSRLTMDPFDVEQWCSAAVAAAGIATPPTLARARLEHDSVIVQRFVPGVPASAGDLAAWAAIGRIAAALADVDTCDAPPGLFSRFGRDLDAAWLQHLDYNLSALTRDDPLLELGAYESGQQDAIRQTLIRLHGRRLQQGLCHGDLSTLNLIAHAAGDYVVIDWGSAHTGPVPWMDLEQIYRWHVTGLTGDPDTRVSDAAWRAVLSGAGMSAKAAGPIIAEVGILHAIDVVRWACDRRPDRIAEFVHQARVTIPRNLANLS